MFACGCVSKSVCNSKKECLRVKIRPSESKRRLYLCVCGYIYGCMCVCVRVSAHASHSDETHPKFSRSHTRATEKRSSEKINPSLKLRNLQRCIKSDISTPCSFREISSFNFFGRLVKFKALLNPKCRVLSCFVEA